MEFAREAGNRGVQSRRHPLVRIETGFKIIFGMGTKWAEEAMGMRLVVSGWGCVRAHACACLCVRLRFHVWGVRMRGYVHACVLACRETTLGDVRGPS